MTTAESAVDYANMLLRATPHHLIPCHARLPHGCCPMRHLHLPLAICTLMLALRISADNIWTPWPETFDLHLLAPETRLKHPMTDDPKALRS